MDLAELNGPEADRRHRREWLGERVGWAILAAILLCGLLGLLGSAGPLNGTEAHAGALTLSHPRFLRHHAPATIRLQAAATGPETEVAFTRSAVEDVVFEQITPEPRSQRTEGDRVIYAFATVDRLEASFQLRPDGYGRRRGTVTVGADSVPLGYFVYP
jgi:hypothetical protein